MGPREKRSSTLSPAEEAIVVEFRQRTLLPLDDVLGRLRDHIPKLTRRALHRCLLRHGKIHMFLAIDRVSKFAYVEFHRRAATMIGAAFRRSTG